MMKIEKMSSKNQNNKKNMSSNADMTWFINTMRNNRRQKNFSKMIQNFEDLFYQKLAKIERADKIFMTWKKLKYVVFICVLNVLFKQTIIIKTQNIIFNYVKMLKIKTNFIIKIVFK